MQGSLPNYPFADTSIVEGKSFCLKPILNPWKRIIFCRTMDLCSNMSIGLMLHLAVQVSLLVRHTILCGCTAKPWAEQQLELSCKPVSTDPLKVWALEEWIHSDAAEVARAAGWLHAWCALPAEATALAHFPFPAVKAVLNILHLSSRPESCPRAASGLRSSARINLLTGFEV